MNITETVRRSSLIMPVNQPRFVEKACLRSADAIVLDLEDSVPPAEKGRARPLVQDAIPVAARGGADVFVRINKPVEMMRARHLARANALAAKEARKAEASHLAGVA
jgi:citrate lyase subunit beta / citryl-CoA lyase